MNSRALNSFILGATVVGILLIAIGLWEFSVFPSQRQEVYVRERVVVVTEESSATPSPRPSPSPSSESLPTESPTVVPELPKTNPKEPELPEGCVVPTGPSTPVHLEPEGVDLALAAGGNPPATNVLAMPPVGGVLPDPPNYDPGTFAWSNTSGELADADGFNALFMAHTYSAIDTPLGNQLLGVLHEGGIIRVTNSVGDVLCYEVVERATVPADYAEALNERSGQGMMIIIVCSDYDGREWTTRTIWLAQMMK